MKTSRETLTCPKVLGDLDGSNPESRRAVKSTLTPPLQIFLLCRMLLTLLEGCVLGLCCWELRAPIICGRNFKASPGCSFSHCLLFCLPPPLTGNGRARGFTIRSVLRDCRFFSVQPTGERVVLPAFYSFRGEDGALARCSGENTPQSLVFLKLFNEGHQVLSWYLSQKGRKELGTPGFEATKYANLILTCLAKNSGLLGKIHTHTHTHPSAFLWGGPWLTVIMPVGTG